MTYKTVSCVPVTCAVCHRRLRGHPCNNGFFAVGRHRERDTGRPCPGFFRYARPVSTREPVVDRVAVWEVTA